MSGETMVHGDALFRTLRTAAATGATVMVHAEDGEVIHALIEDALAAGRTHPREHARTRPPVTEAMAVERIARLARFTGARLYVVHVSCAEALAAVAAAPEVVGETCPQYLVLDERVLDGDAAEAAKYVFTPPPRTVRDQDALWDALAAGTLQTIGSDHGGYSTADKQRSASFDRIPQGLPGIEQRLGLVHHFGVASGRLSPSRMVELVATGPARVFGLLPRKGAIAIGADADLVVFDPEGETVVTASTQHSATDYTPYEGLVLRGAVETVLVRGGMVVSHGETVGVPGHGEFVARAPAGEELAAPALEAPAR
jgi:dihydropyrimidinase